MGAAARASDRLDEAIPPAGNAADRRLDPPLVAVTARRLAARAGDVLSALSVPLQTASSRTSRFTTTSTTTRSTGLDSAEQIRELERAIVLAADVTVCVSRLRAEELIAMVPEAAGRIHHVPHGTPTPFLATCRSCARRRRLGRPGAAAPPLSRLRRLARGPRGLGADGQAQPRRFPTRRSWWSGACVEPVAEPWWEALLAVPFAPQRPRPGLAAAGGDRAVLPGVRRLLDSLPHRPSVQPGLQPDQDHGRDGLGPADRRDGDPECRLHAERFDVVESDDEFIAAVRAILARHSDDGRAGLRHAYALRTRATGWASGSSI